MAEQVKPHFDFKSLSFTKAVYTDFVCLNQSLNKPMGNYMKLMYAKIPVITSCCLNKETDFCSAQLMISPEYYSFQPTLSVPLD